MADSYRTHIQIYRATKAALEGWMHRAVKAHDNGRGDAWWEGLFPTASEAVQELLRRDIAHRSRAKRAKVAAKAKRAKGPIE